ncbi:MAG: hypothetical protein SCH71_02245 [Desulfobulbaceae bacterium]|nr:hypothetical protein [Desulfobulbaceae bacterium]
MNCWTSYSSKFAWLPVFVLLVLPWGCTGKNAQLSGDLPEGAGQLNEGISEDMLIAFLPLENLSSGNAPMEEIYAALGDGLSRKGFRLLDRERLEEFRKKYRMRYIGGTDSFLAEAMREELGTDAVLITSLEAYQEAEPPQISLISRLVSCGPEPEIIWIDSIGLSGDESPGFLDLKRIWESGKLLEKAVDKLAGSLADHFHPAAGDEPFFSIPESWKTDKPGTLMSPRYRLNMKYLPYDYFRSPLIDPDRQYAIAVLPMLDLAVRKKAGIIAQLHFVRELFNLTDFKVLEPGLVRDGLLRIRAVMPQGPSLAETDLITSQGFLGVDLVLSGRVFDYQNTSFNPKVDFSMQIIEKTSRRVVFGARVFKTGLERVYFFNFGRVYTAHKLLQEMARVNVQLLTNSFGRWEAPEEFIALQPPWKRDDRNLLDPEPVPVGGVWDAIFF